MILVDLDGAIVLFVFAISMISLGISIGRYSKRV